MSEEHEEKHLQLGTNLDDDDRTLLSEDEIEDVWEDSITVDQFKEDIEELREAGWPTGDEE